MAITKVAQRWVWPELRFWLSGEKSGGVCDLRIAVWMLWRKIVSDERKWGFFRSKSHFGILIYYAGKLG